MSFKRACVQSGLLTQFGTPAYECFGTFGYFAAVHKDDDIGPSSVDITFRGNGVSIQDAGYG